MTKITISERTWEEIYPRLQATALRLVYQLHVPYWRGKEYEIAQDILQETARKALEYTQKIERSGGEPIQSYIALLTTIAKNYSKDLRRREWRLSRDNAAISQTLEAGEVGPDEIAVEQVYDESLFYLLAHAIVRFPPRQREVLLTDLASRMSFDGQPSALQAAFHVEGIHLEDYRGMRPKTARERSQNAALLNHAYKRLKTIEEVKQYLI